MAQSKKSRSWAQCPFGDCGMAGLDIEILHWDTDLGIDASWPELDQQLRYGMRSDASRDDTN